MTYDDADLHRKNLALLIESMRENLALRELVKRSFPDDGDERIEAVLSDRSIQNMVTVQMAQVLESDRRLKDILRQVEGLSEDDELPQKPTRKPH